MASYDKSQLELFQEKFKVKLTNLGMQGLEYVLKGGFPMDSVYLLTGASGTYFAQFAQQALYNHLITKGKVAYYTVETPTSDIEQDMAVFGWNVSKYIDDGSWVFGRPLPPQLMKLAEMMPETPGEQRIPLTESSLHALAQNFLGKLKEGRWTALNLSHLLRIYPIKEIIELVMFWVNAAHKYGGVHFLLLNGGMNEEVQVNYIKSLVDGVLVFKFAQGFEQAEGEIEIEKLRRVLPSTKIVRHVVQEDGIAIETTARIG
jgi:KaiC/GvpD/RAD55 family RecA-like ATPase